MRVTLDTNQLVRALMRPPQLATFLMAWESERFQVICSPELLEEYSYVLANADVRSLIFPELYRAFQTHLIHTLEMVVLDTIPAVCRDPDDDKVVATAISGHVDYMITEDKDLQTPEIRELLHREGIAVASMNELLNLLG